MSRMRWGALALMVLGLAAVPAQASIEVQVGYADELRPSPFFPNPWQGGSGVALFAGGASTLTDYDAGAIRVINNGGSAVSIQDLVVSGFGDGSSYQIWGGFLGTGFSLAPGMSAIFTQTVSYNFDTSDNQGGGPATAVPVVTLTVDGVTTSFNDTAQVLNTEGTDHLAAAGLNESHGWRDIGTFGGQAGVPEPSTLAIAGLSGLALLGRAWMKRRNATA